MNVPEVTVVGSPLSPYVRKVLVVLQQKGLAWRIDPIVPFYGSDRFSQLSPLRRIPVLIDDRTTLSDSSVICEYLEDRYPQPRLYPEDLVARAQARWLEEFADTRMGDVLIWGLFNNLAIGPAVWGREPDAAALEQTREVDLPQVLDYLESRAPESGFLFGDLSIADVAVACFFRNAQFVKVEIDARRWPRCAAWVGSVLDLESFAALRDNEQLLLRHPPASHWQRLREAGAAVTPETLGMAAPRPGVMKI